MYLPRGAVSCLQCVIVVFPDHTHFFRMVSLHLMKYHFIRSKQYLSSDGKHNSAKAGARGRENFSTLHYFSVFQMI